MSDTLTNISAFLPKAAAERPYALAVACPAGRDSAGRPAFAQYSLKQLNEACDSVAHGLVSYGIKRGTRTVLMVPPGLDFFALTFALFKIGAVPVIVDPGMGIKKLGACLKEAEPAAFVGIPKAHIARIVLGWAKTSLQRFVTVGRKLGWSGVTLEELELLGDRSKAFPVAQTAEDDLAAILFTSGATGIPKGVEYSHGNFLAQVRSIQESYEIEPGEVDLATFPLFGLFDPALGMATIVPEMDASKPGAVNPWKLKEAIETFGCTNMFGSPALLRKWTSVAVPQGWTFPSLKRVISAGAPVPAEVLELVSKVLRPEVQIFTPYGATESLPVCKVGSHELLALDETRKGGGVCIGRPVAEVEVRLIEITDEPIPNFSDARETRAGEVGEICVRGPRVTRSYFHRPEATKLAKMADGEGFWHRMGDLGRFDDQGRLWFCGRKAHRVETSSGPLFSDCVEGIFNAHPAVARSALVGPKIGGLVRPVVCIELDRRSESALRPWQAVLAELKALAASHAMTWEIVDFVPHPGFPVDVRHNSKINREALKLWIEKRGLS